MLIIDHISYKSYTSYKSCKLRSHTVRKPKDRDGVDRSGVGMGLILGRSGIGLESVWARFGVGFGMF